MFHQYPVRCPIPRIFPDGLSLFGRYRNGLHLAAKHVHYSWQYFYLLQSVLLILADREYRCLTLMVYLDSIKTSFEADRSAMSCNE